MARVALDHLICGFKTRIGDFSHRELLMVSFFCADHGGIASHRKVNPRGVLAEIFICTDNVSLKSLNTTIYCIAHIYFQFPIYFWPTINILLPGVRNQICLELGEIHIESSVEPEGGGDGGDDLTDEAVQVGVGGTVDVKVAAADVVDGLVVDHEGAVGVLQRGVSRQDRVVRLHHRRGNLRRRVNGELQLRLFAVVD